MNIWYELLQSHIFGRGVPTVKKRIDAWEVYPDKLIVFEGFM